MPWGQYPQYPVKQWVPVSSSAPATPAPWKCPFFHSSFGAGLAQQDSAVAKAQLAHHRCSSSRWGGTGQEAHQLFGAALSRPEPDSLLHGTELWKTALQVQLEAYHCCYRTAPGMENRVLETTLGLPLPRGPLHLPLCPASHPPPLSLTCGASAFPHLSQHKPALPFPPPPEPALHSALDLPIPSPEATGGLYPSKQDVWPATPGWPSGECISSESPGLNSPFPTGILVLIKNSLTTTTTTKLNVAGEQAPMPLKWPRTAGLLLHCPDNILSKSFLWWPAEPHSSSDPIYQLLHWYSPFPSEQWPSAFTASGIFKLCYEMLSKN